MTESVASPFESKKVTAFLFAFLFIKSLLFVFLVPPWLGNDEANHFEYVLVLAGEGAGKSNQKRIIDSLNRTGYWAKADMKHPAEGAALFENTDLRNHSEEMVSKRPFLYYWLASLPIKFFDVEKLTVKLVLARLVSALISLFAVSLIYLSAKIVFEGPSQTAAACTAAALAGLHPQFSYISASVNSDVLAIALFCLVFYWFVKRIKDGVATPESIALLLFVIALAMLTKKHSVSLFPISLFGLALVVSSGAGQMKKVFGNYIWFFGFSIVAVLMAEYFAATDVIKLADRIGITLGYFAPSAEDLGQISFGGYVRAFAVMFVTYWFAYGQMVYKLSFGFYLIYGLFTVVVISGFAKKIFHLIRGRNFNAPQTRYMVFSLFFFAVVLLMIVVSFFTPQFIDRVSGRYLFYALAPVTIITIYGLKEISRLLKRYDLEILAVYMFIAMNFLALFSYLMPIYHA